MINKLRFLTFSAAIMFMQSTHAAKYTFGQMLLLQNDKEPMVTAFSKKERQKIIDKYSVPAEVQKHSLIFYSSVQDTLNNNPGVCEFGLVSTYINKLTASNYPADEKSIEEYLKVLRVDHTIDDILYKIVSDANKDYFALKNLNTSKKLSKIGAPKKLLDNNDVEDLFEGLATWPNDRTSCTYQTFAYVKNNIWESQTKKSTSAKDVRDMMGEAYKRDLISLETYHKLLYLNNKADIDKRDLWLRNYLQIVFLAKNKMVPNQKTYTVKNIEDENSFSTEKIRRFSKITRRRNLYRKYDETQIILLSQVLQKASRRMGTDPDTESKTPYITQEFIVRGKNGKKETVVETLKLDPQSQFNLARRRLRKDMVDLQMMDLFNKTTITYEDVVMAALETGYVTLEDMQHVVQYDDLWNPNISRFEKVSGFIFTVAGYSTFFIPAPWNVVATIALGVAEGIVDNKLSTGEDNDNPATFIE